MPRCYCRRLIGNHEHSILHGCPRTPRKVTRKKAVRKKAVRKKIARKKAVRKKRPPELHDVDKCDEGGALSQSLEKIRDILEEGGHAVVDVEGLVEAAQHDVETALEDLKTEMQGKIQTIFDKLFDFAGDLNDTFIDPLEGLEGDLDARRDQLNLREMDDSATNGER